MSARFGKALYVRLYLREDATKAPHPLALAMPNESESPPALPRGKKAALQERGQAPAPSQTQSPSRSHKPSRAPKPPPAAEPSPAPEQKQLPFQPDTSQASSSDESSVTALRSDELAAADGIPPLELQTAVPPT